ncbi:RNA methyltransferase, TrmA family [Thermaerobacter marianensis DSM 12885]|uniref:RNA methyltransferase, TrmA family n=1 Tax=Thermaerobacter marianensis (strain ATCC 700841 / DSM 12885 / JCM 10246 / 7p75a) TaxID=644966 RepID=E6SGX9_THEM7|nr:23S rRNA (uracil(1939)-C(5))-methyltransferase RlmD [Thermaerobacter marianensis]ADU50610.1 RNA methyltransferase, TrmA family [Thermaerobacter marianensis DSM 12885]
MSRERRGARPPTNRPRSATGRERRHRHRPGAGDRDGAAAGGTPGAGRPLRPGQVIELEPHALAAGGDAVARYGGMAVFVPWAVPGDRLRVRVVDVKPRFARAEPEALLVPGPGRVDPACPLFARCGGCRLQHLAYPQQLAWKRQMVVDALERIGRIPDPPVGETLGMDPPWYYRNKAAIPVRRLPSGRVVMGFFAPGTHAVIDLEATGCAIQHPVINQVVAALRRWLEEDPDGRATSTYDETRHQGLLRHLVVRVGLRSGEALAGLVVNGEGLPGEERLARYLRREVPQLVGVVKNLHRRPGNAILGPETVPLDGRPWIFDELGGLRFRISLESFYQVNPVQAERLYRLALDYALGRPITAEAPKGPGPGSLADEPAGRRALATGEAASVTPGGAMATRAAPAAGGSGLPTGDATAGGGAGFWLVDAYAGIGTLALLAAARLRDGVVAQDRRSWRVTAIEVVPEATEDARTNAALNGLENVEFVTGAVEEVLPHLAAALQEAAGTGPGRGGPDVVLLDPPRKGCDPAALAACLELAPPRIVYVSCNPVTLARDLAVLCDTGSPAAPPLPALPRPAAAAGAAGAGGEAAMVEGVPAGGATAPGAAAGGGTAGDAQGGVRPRRRPRYRVVAVRPVDMFPQTAHVECVALLERDDGGGPAPGAGTTGPAGTATATAGAITAGTGAGDR